MNNLARPAAWVRQALRAGLVIPAHPLALTAERRFDERRQRALTRYYHAAGAGGIAVAVHTTQFAIREAKHGLYRPVLALASETMEQCDRQTGRQTVRVAGICGPTEQATKEASLARELGYHAGLLMLAALRDASDDELIAHCWAVACEIPLFGFYLYPALGGRPLSRAFWRRFVEIDNVVAIKVAPFNRYQTLDVIRAVVEAGRGGDIALYTGNDDSIILDLLCEYELTCGSEQNRVPIVGGLLGHWAVWTRQAVEHLQACHAARASGATSATLLSLAGKVTDANGVLFDAAHDFAGSLPGIYEVLRRQGLLAHSHCLDPNVGLSPGQAEEIDRIQRAYPELNDDEFVKQNLDAWLS